VQGLRILKNGQWNKPPVLTAARLLLADSLANLYETQPLGNMAEFLNGTSYDAGLLSETGLPIIRISNITDPASVYIRSSEKFPERFIVNVGDLLVSWSASFKSIIWPGPVGVLNQHIFKVTEKDGFNRRFIKHMIEAAFDEMQKNVVGMGMMHLRRKDFLGHHVPSPPQPIQASIAEYLDWIEQGCRGNEPRLPDELDEQRRIVAKIDALAARIDEAKRLRKAIQADMDSLLVAMAHRNDLSDKEKQAQGWERVALGEVLTQVSDPVEVEPGEEYPHFGIYSFAKGLFKKAPLLGNEIKASKLYRVSQGQFIYGRLNAYEGAFAIITPDYDQHYVSNEFPAFACVPDRVLPEFLLAYFSTPAVWEGLKRKVTGIGGGAGNRRIRLKESILLSEEIWLPPIEWQQKIKSTAERLAASRPVQEAAGWQLDALLPAILDRAFKGKL